MNIMTFIYKMPWWVDAWHGIVRPQDADEGKVSSMEGSYKYIKNAVVDSQQMVVLTLGGWARC
jgi:hypothetical protein